MGHVSGSLTANSSGPTELQIAIPGVDGVWAEASTTSEFVDDTARERMGGMQAHGPAPQPAVSASSGAEATRPPSTVRAQAPAAVSESPFLTADAGRSSRPLAEAMDAEASDPLAVRPRPGVSGVAAAIDPAEAKDYHKLLWAIGILGAAALATFAWWYTQRG